MNTIRKVALSLGSAALVITGGVGLASVANAETPTTTPPAPATQQWQRGMRNGAGYGATENATDLAKKLGVSADAVKAALAKYHAENPVTTRGRDLTDAQRDAAHKKLAAFLATELKVDEADVLDALEARPVERRTERSAQIKSRLETAVEDGRLTQAQADAIVAAHESGAMGGGMGGKGRGMGGGMGHGPRR